jgi:hypothetical protein
MEYKYVKAAIDDYGVEMTSKMIAILKADGSRNLVSQIDQKIIEDMHLNILEINIPDYGYYASEGRAAGSFPPLSSIRKWMMERNIDMAALFPISRKIASLGTKASASHFLKEFKITSQFESDLLDAYTKDVETALIKYVNKLNAEEAL